MHRRVGHRVVLLPGIAALGLLAAGFQIAATSHADEQDLERLEFKAGHPRTVVVYPGAGKEAENDDYRKAGRVFWYLPYTLKNIGTKPAKFFVSVSAVSDKDVKYSDLPLLELEQRVEQVEQRKLLSKADLRAEKRPASDYEGFAPDEVKECVALFNPLDPEADKVTIMIHGLVNDIQVKELGGGKWEITERVLEVVFERPGDEFYTSLDRFLPGGQKWKAVPSTVQMPAGGE